MNQKNCSGLRKRGPFWYIDKQFLGHRIRESTYTTSLREAERLLVHRMNTIRESVLYGIRPKRLFREAAQKFLREHQHKRSIQDDELLLKKVLLFIGEMPLDTIHRGSLAPFIEARVQEGVKNQTINRALQLVGHILKLAATEWVDAQGLTWLASHFKIKPLPELEVRQAYPLIWDEQCRLFSELPKHLTNMALFAVNTGTRDQEICKLEWAWEVKSLELPELVLFIIPAFLVKNGYDRLVVCNDTARNVIEAQRGRDPTYVFGYQGRALHHMLNHGWRNARVRAGLPQVRVHDLKHTFGRRLRAAGVSFEDRQDLLGHKSSRITTHYSGPELHNLYQAANKVSEPYCANLTIHRQFMPVQNTALQALSSLMTTEEIKHVVTD